MAVELMMNCSTTTFTSESEEIAAVEVAYRLQSVEKLIDCSLLSTRRISPPTRLHTFDVLHSRRHPIDGHPRQISRRRFLYEPSSSTSRVAAARPFDPPMVRDHVRRDLQSPSLPSPRQFPTLIVVRSGLHIHRCSALLYGLHVYRRGALLPLGSLWPPCCFPLTRLPLPICFIHIISLPPPLTNRGVISFVVLETREKGDFELEKWMWQDEKIELVRQ